MIYTTLMNRKAIICSLLALVLVFVIACGGESTSAPPTTEVQATQQAAAVPGTPVPQPEATAAAVATVRPQATDVPSAEATAAPEAGLANLGISDATIDPDRRTPHGTLTVGLHYNHSPKWLDPQEYNSPVFNHFIYIIHDALIKPMGGNVWTYSLAEYAEMPADYTYAKFRLREGLTFQDGTPLTTEDVKWSFENYRGTHSDILKEKTTSIEVVDDRNITFYFNEPFLDFIDIYTVVGGANWVLPREYYEELGAEAFKQNPMGAGPFKFLSMDVGKEMVFEAWDGYWRKVPHAQTLRVLGVGDPAAQWAGLQTGDLDVAYLVLSPLWDQVFANPDLQWDPNHTSPWFLMFPNYNLEDSPFGDKRVREAVSLAINREFINIQELKGQGTLFGNWIGSDTPGVVQDLPIPQYDPERAKQLLAAAGYPDGFEIDSLTPLPPFFSKAERILTDLQAIGIRGSVQILEGPAFLSKVSLGSEGWPGGTTIVENISNNPGNASHYITRYATCDASQSFVCDPEVDAMWAQFQASADPEERAQLLDSVQRRLIEEFLIVPIYINSFLHVAGPNVTGDISNYYQMPQAWGPWPFEEWQVLE